MNKEIRERKRRFLAGMLILALVFGNIVIPTSALATGYNITNSVSFDALDGNIVWPGDTITYNNYNASVDVTYLDKDGTQLSTQEISINPDLDPDPYTVSSYTGSLTNFEGWEVGFLTGSGQKIKSMTFRATGTNYVPVYYTINYHLDGGTNDADNPSSYEYGYGVNSFKDAVKENYSFEGWYTDADFAKERTYISPADSGTIDMYAKFKADEYKIDYKLDGGSNSADNPTGYAYGEGVAKFEDAVKEGYTFEGWYSDAAFTTPITEVSKTQTGDVTLYAKYKVSEYGIAYELDGGTNAESNPANYTYGVGVEKFEDAVKEGYTFEGWYSDAAFTTKVTSIDATQTGDVTLYAKYKANEYGIVYELDGGTNAESNPTNYTYGVGVEKFEDAVKEGYTFEGWYSDGEFTTPITEVSKTQTGDVTLYAKYKANEYAVAYELDGGTNAEANPVSYTYGEGIAKFEDAMKEGYTFEGWYSDGEFTTPITEVSKTQTGDVTLYAKYKANEYAVTYELDGGINAEANPVSYTYGEGIAKFEDAMKEGYTFEGWYSDAEFTTPVTEVSKTQMGNVTIYAKYKANEYGIVYELDGGINAEANPTNYTYGVGVVSFEDAAKEGYTFEGWYSDAVFTTKVTAIDVTQTGEVTLYAKFVKVEEEVKEDKKVEVDKKDKKDKKDKQDKQDTANIGEDTPKTGAEADEDSDKSPETGDNAPIEQMYLLMLLAGVGMFLCRKKKAVV